MIIFTLPNQSLTRYFNKKNMNNLDKQYQDLLKDILENGIKKGDRTGTGTISVFGRTIRHKMSDGFPLITTKKMFTKGIITELIWFLKGDTNIKWLVDNGCNIWNGDAYKKYTQSYASGVAESTWNNNGEPWDMENFVRLIKTDDRFAKLFGNLGEIYGAQWRRWNTNKTIVIGHNGHHNEWGTVIVDQISNLINDLKNNPDSRRLMVNAWNVPEVPTMVLPPCHYGFQLYTRELTISEKRRLLIPVGLDPMSDNGIEKLFREEVGLPKRAISLMWQQRSVDTLLGLPFNIASYGFLLEAIAKEVNMVPDELIGNLGDTHLYLNHIEQAQEQITREPYALPTLQITIDPGQVFSITNNIHIGNFKINDYQSHAAIKAEISN